jgi:hypothetical protein
MFYKNENVIAFYIYKKYNLSPVWTYYFYFLNNEEYTKFFI